MTDKELHRLKRPELLEMLFYLQKEMEKIKKENEALRQQILNGTLEKSLSDEDIERIAEAVKKHLAETPDLGSGSADKKAGA